VKTIADGVACGRWRLTPGTGAVLLVALAPFEKHAFDTARNQGRREPADAYTADALARHALDGPTSDGPDAQTGHTHKPRSDGSRAKIIVRIDHTALRRGHTHAGETCEIAGIGPVPAAIAHDCMNDAFLAAIVTNDTDIRAIVHLGRHPTALQHTALRWRDPECVALGCHTQTGLETDHRIDWATTHHTTLDELDTLSPHHHDLKTRHNHHLTPGPGKRPIHPPTRPGPNHPHRSPRWALGRPAGETVSRRESSRRGLGASRPRPAVNRPALRSPRRVRRG